MVKKLILCLLLCAPALGAAPLKLGPQAKAEAALYMDFLKAVYAEQESDQAACRQYQKTFAKAPDNKFLKRILITCALAADDMKAADAYADFITQGENSAEDLAVYAFYQWQKGDLRQAQDYYDRALQKAPDDQRILYQYVLLMSFIDVDSAAEKLGRLKADFPSLSHIVDYETGNLYRSKKQPEKALEFYNLATRAAPDYAEPYLARAEMYEKSSRFFLMLRELELLEKTGYESAGMYSRMASVYLISKDEKKAKEYFLKAKDLDNADVSAAYFLALFAEKEGNFAAAAQYLRASSDFDTSAGKWLQTAFYEQRAGDMQGALATLKEAYKKFKNNVEIGYFYALALQDVQEYRRAAKVLKGVLKTNPTYESARVAYAFALDGAKKYKQMEKQVRLVLEQNPKNAAAYNLLAFSLAERGVRLDEAQELAIKALEINPHDRSFTDTLAWVYYKKGEYARALDLLSSLDGEFVAANADVSYHLGAVYAAAGQYAKARPLLLRASARVKEAGRLLQTLPAAPAQK